MNGAELFSGAGQWQSWNTMADGSGVQYTYGMQLPIAENMTLYAIYG